MRLYFALLGFTGFYKVLPIFFLGFYMAVLAFLDSTRFDGFFFFGRGGGAWSLCFVFIWGRPFGRVVSYVSRSSIWVTVLLPEGAIRNVYIRSFLISLCILLTRSWYLAMKRSARCRPTAPLLSLSLVFFLSFLFFFIFEWDERETTNGRGEEDHSRNDDNKQKKKKWEKKCKRASQQKKRSTRKSIKEGNNKRKENTLAAPMQNASEDASVGGSPGRRSQSR